ncbi:hypothetical protein OsJ_35087 [Oryza sativa Japonica Group]|uniref:Uncharacterized protein n=3 Tax=Oryza TaxID=4527 RepID=A0A8J8XKK8_ORYSJ|nr:expressed protein [Oryza sativa Japonica Group]EAZ19522.1 hypothetical protein OsJ_35087 [Oryza sativa Japonica Group]
MYPLLNEVDLGAFTNCSSALDTLKPSRTVLRLFIDSEMLLMMMTIDLHKLFFGPLTDDETLMLMKALHKLFFGPSLIDDDDEKLRCGDDEVTMKASSDGELMMMRTSSDREMIHRWVSSFLLLCSRRTLPKPHAAGRQADNHNGHAAQQWRRAAMTSVQGRPAKTGAVADDGGGLPPAARTRSAT